MGTQSLPAARFSPHLWGRRWLRGEAIKRPTVSVMRVWTCRGQHFGESETGSHVLWWT